jgi:hypothetical protein
MQKMSRDRYRAFLKSEYSKSAGEMLLLHTHTLDGEGCLHGDNVIEGANVRISEFSFLTMNYRGFLLT